MRNKALGRGLSSLLREEVVPIESVGSVNQIKLDLIDANKEQPRKYFNDDHLQELADSIAVHGVLQPIIVVKDGGGRYKIVAGERRFKASKIVGLKEVPVIIKELNDKEVFEVALIENIQRDELTCIEEAQGYQKLVNDYGYTQSDIAISVGKSRSHIANLIRLNQLPSIVQTMISEGLLSMGHARCLIGHPDAIELAERIVKLDLSVRKTEELVSQKKETNTVKKTPRVKKDEIIYQEQDDDLKMLGESLTKKLGVKVIVENSANGGRISLHYSTLEELDLILTTLD